MEKQGAAANPSSVKLQDCEVLFTNAKDQYNCFLNVVMQIFIRIDSFGSLIQSILNSQPDENQQVVGQLKTLLTEISSHAKQGSKPVVSLDPLRKILAEKKQTWF